MLVTCFSLSGSGQIGIISADPDPFLQQNVKPTILFQKFQNTVENIEIMTPLKQARKVQECKLALM
jgi:hypothetical protein